MDREQRALKKAMGNYALTVLFTQFEDEGARWHTVAHIRVQWDDGRVEEYNTDIFGTDPEELSALLAEVLSDFQEERAQRLQVEYPNIPAAEWRSALPGGLKVAHGTSL